MSATQVRMTSNELSSARIPQQDQSIAAKLEQYSTAKLADLLTLASVMKGLFSAEFVEQLEIALAGRSDMSSKVVRFAH